LSGADAAVADYLRAQPESEEILAQIEAFPAPLAAELRGRPAQLPDGGHRLHRRSAPLGVHRRAVAQRFADFGAGARAAPRTGCERLNDPDSRRDGDGTDPHSLPSLALFPLQSVLFPRAICSCACSSRATSIW
jgi:hypothetical protein